MKFMKKAFATFLGLLLVAKPISAKIIDTSHFMEVKEEQTNGDFKNWKKVHSHEGKCSATFPKTPEQLQQKMAMKGEDKELQYYVYVADHNRKEVFMVLIAQYPGKVNQEDAVKNLEYFLNTLIAQNSKNRLLGADLIDVQGYPGMDFFIRTDQVYFKGRAIQANNSLYLLAMECEIPNYQEAHYNFFIESFELHLD
jgi:hypothetical protein